MKSENKQVDSYDISSYDTIYILFKPNAGFKNLHPKFCKYDKSKNKYYTKGKAIKHIVKNAGGQTVYSYPTHGAISFIHETDIVNYNNTRSDVKKQEMILTIHFGDIDFITLAFDSLDWK